MGRRILSVLLIEDSSEYAYLIQHWLSSADADVGFALSWSSTLAAGNGCLETGGVDVILLDLGLPDCQGFETYTQTRAHAPKTPIVVLGSSDLDPVALAIKREGLSHYLVKSACGGEAIIRAVRYASQSNAESARITIQIPKELPRKLVFEYLADCGNNLIELKADVIKHDYQHARVCGHGMKGTGSPYGFPMLTQLGAAIEKAATCEKAPELEKQVDQLAEYLGRLQLV